MARPKAPALLFGRRLPFQAIGHLRPLHRASCKRGRLITHKVLFIVPGNPPDPPSSGLDLLGNVPHHPSARALEITSLAASPPGHAGAQGSLTGKPARSLETNMMNCP
jgi:hypothetical protein